MILLYIHNFTISKEASSQGISVFSASTSILVDSLASKLNRSIPFSSSLLLNRMFLLCYKLTSSLTSLSSQFLISIMYPFSFSTLLTTIYCSLSTISLTKGLSNTRLFILSIKSFSMLPLSYQSQFISSVYFQNTKQSSPPGSDLQRSNPPKS